MLRAHKPPMDRGIGPKTRLFGGLGWSGLWGLWAILSGVLSANRGTAYHHLPGVGG
ncbi:hypothetical protein ACN38_g13251, partial [Penicillium nordicum]